MNLACTRGILLIKIRSLYFLLTATVNTKGATRPTFSCRFFMHAYYRVLPFVFIGQGRYTLMFLLSSEIADARGQKRGAEKRSHV